MTNEKARDFFSAYYEGTLESGLSQSFEQKLRNDTHLSSEYRSFVDAMESLDLLKLEEIAVPADLEERIAVRLDKAIYDRKRVASPGWSVWLRNFAFAGLGAVAILGAVLSLNRQPADAVEAGTFKPKVENQATVRSTDAGVEYLYAPSEPKTVVVTNAAGKEMQRVSVGDAKSPEFKSLLKNDNQAAALFGVQIVPEAPSYVAVPGRARGTVKAGDGSILDFATAVAGFYQSPVMVRTADPSEKLAWTFESSDSVGEVGRILGTRFRVTLTQDDVLLIEQN